MIKTPMRKLARLFRISTAIQLRKLKSILLCSTLLIGQSACISQAPIYLNAEQCAKLIPKAWKEKGVESAPLPVERTVGALGSFGISQTGQLDKSNDRSFAIINIVEQCEAFVEEARKKIEPKPWYQFW